MTLKWRIDIVTFHFPAEINALCFISATSRARDVSKGGATGAVALPWALPGPKSGPVGPARQPVSGPEGPAFGPNQGQFWAGRAKKWKGLFRRICSSLQA